MIKIFHQIIKLLIWHRKIFPNFSNCSCFWKANLKTFIKPTLTILCIIIPWICPELSKVHIKGEIHEFLWEVSDGENVKSDSNSDWDTAIVGADSSVVANLEGVEDGGDVERAGGCDVQQGGEAEREQEGEPAHGSDVAARADLCQLRMAATTVNIM